MLKQVAAQAENGRRLVIYEQVTGFLAPWYMRLRISEECARSKRYERPLSVMLIRPQANDDDLRTWLLRGLRSTDLVSHTVEGSYFLLLTETDEAGCAEVLKRLEAAAGVSEIESASYLTEADRFDALVESLDAGRPGA